MKLFKTTAIAMVAIAGLYSCSKDDNGSNNVEDQSLKIFIGQPADTRSIDTPEAGKTSPVVFADGELFLCDASGRIEYVYTFSSAATAGTNINIGDATTGNGVTLDNIKGTVSQAVIVGNSSSITGTALTAYNTAKVVGGNISAVKAVQLTPAMQYNSTAKDLSKVTLYGEGTVQDPDPAGIADRLVEVELWPQVARLELSDITAVGTDPLDPPVVNITKYNVDGIYINNFYSTMTLNHVVPAGSLTNGGQGDATVYGNGIAPYSTIGIVHDYDATYFGNTDVNLIKYANGTNNTEVWAYNLFASKTALTTVAPQIIVAVTDVEADNMQNYSGRKFITANKLYDSSSNEITHFQAGKIYQIEPGDFEFTVKNLHTSGNIGETDLRVKVSIIQWTTESMKPGLQE